MIPIELITFLIRAFNAVLCVSIIIYLIANFKKLKVYKTMNLAFIAVLIYIASLFITSVILGQTINPIFSAIGAMFNILVILIAVLAEVN